MKQKPIISHVMVATKGSHFTSQAIESLREHSRVSYELIVIDNGTPKEDGTSAWLDCQDDIKVIRSDKLICYSAALNLGLKASDPDSQYLGILNNDLLFTDNWDGKLTTIIDNKMEIPGYDKIGIAAPMSNSVAGLQQIPEEWCGKYDPNNMENFVRQIEDQVYANSDKNSQILKLGFLSGFCWIMSRECYETVGDFTEFYPYGFEDNDYCKRAKDDHGFALVAVRASFVHHFAGRSVAPLKQEAAQRGMINRFPFYNLRAKMNDHPMKLVAGYRVQNEEKYLKRSLEKMSEIADEIIVYDDHSTDNTVKIAKEFSKVKLIQYEHDPSDFNEARDRELLLKACRDLSPNWIVIQDGDEVFEEKATREYFEKLMRPIKPNITCYVFRHITHWNDENLQRADGAHGKMANGRLFLNTPNLHVLSQDKHGFHCSAIGVHAHDTAQMVPLRVRHFGYVDPKERRRKYDFYEKMDTEKNPIKIGGNDYRHIMDTNVRLIEYQEKINLGLTMIVRDEAPMLEQYLDLYHQWFDEMVIVDTGSTDDTKEIAEYYGAKVFDYKWSDNFAAARNFAKSKSTADWVFQADPDEQFPPQGIMDLYRMIEEPHIGYMFMIVNQLPDGAFFWSEACRLYRNIPEIRYNALNPDSKYGIHETVSNSIAKIKDKGRMIWVEEQLAINHFGYLISPIELQKKLKYYASICDKILLENPDDGTAHYSIALNMIDEEKIDKARYHFELAIKNFPELTQSNQQLARLDLLSAVKHLEYVVKVTHPGHPAYKASVEWLQLLQQIPLKSSGISLLPGRDYRGMMQ